ncbi:MAG: hypothetical protein R3316_12740, partial [Rhodovibrionaceae bacterium]|nr:hypothetical protein [Rhodovibrionaceae bacterium]
IQGTHPDETPTVQVRNGPGQEPTAVKVTDKETGEVLIDKTVGETNAIGSMPRLTGGALIVAFKKHDGTPVKVEVPVPTRRHVVITVDTFFGRAEITDETRLGRGTLGSEPGFTAGD